MALIYLATDAEFTLRSLPLWSDSFPLNTLITFADKRAANWRRRIQADSVRMIDSGAFTVHMRGGEINLADYIAEASNPYWDECAALDVIGDARASFANAERMRTAGLENVIPVFHIGEPWEFLDEYKRKFRRVGLGGVARMKGNAKMRWLEQCFSRAWPALFHLYGITSPEILNALPADTADSSSWEFGPRRFGQSIRGRIGAKRGGCIDLGGEVLEYRRMQERSEAKWGPMLAPLRAALPIGLRERRERLNSWRANEVH